MAMIRMLDAKLEFDLAEWRIGLFHLRLLIGRLVVQRPTNQQCRIFNSNPTFCTRFQQNSSRHEARRSARWSEFTGQD